MTNTDDRLHPLELHEWLAAADTAYSQAVVGARLAAIALLRAHLPLMERDGVEQAVAAGWTWAEIARVLSVSRQTVHERYAKTVDGSEPWRPRYRRLNLGVEMGRHRALIEGFSRGSGTTT